MRAHWPVSLFVAAALVVGGGVAAMATAPVTLGGARVLDQSDVLSSSQEASVQARLSELSSSGVDLWVAYVDDFTNPADPEDWANQTASDNGLGPNQYLLAVSTDGRQFYLSGDDSGPVSGDQLTAIEQDRIRPALQGEDWAGAAVAAADGLADAADGGSGGTGGSSAGSSVTPIILIAILLALAALVIWIVVRSRRKTKASLVAGAAPAEAPQLTTAELAQQAASALVQTDDAVKTSEQELGFAEAQFGEETATEFQQALAHAKDDLDKAFSLKQQLDDEVPDSEADVRQWNTQILELCAHANEELDEKAAAFDELRGLEKNAPEALTRVEALLASASAGQDAAAQRLSTLTQSYAPEALATVTGNPAQTQELLAFAQERLTTAQAAVGAGDGAAAAVSIRAAEDAVGSATRLQAAVSTLGSDLERGDQEAAAVIADLETDLATASALPDADGRLAPTVAATRQQMDAARTLLTGNARRPLKALESLNQANTQIDALLEQVRDTAQKAQRASQQLAMVLTQAQGQVTAAEDFITSRRGAIGAEARTRLAEAGASLVQARQLQQADPAQALSFASRANDLAAQAIQYAQNDVGSFSGGGSSNSGGNNNMMGAVLGGILINSLLGGGGGGSRGGGMFGGGGGGFGGGGRSPGSFGGGGTRARRGGGRF